MEKACKSLLIINPCRRKRLIFKDLLKDVCDSSGIYLQFFLPVVCHIAIFPTATCKQQTKMSYA